MASLSGKPSNSRKSQWDRDIKNPGEFKKLGRDQNRKVSESKNWNSQSHSPKHRLTAAAKEGQGTEGTHQSN
jgi:hypothetical protein